MSLGSVANQKRDIGGPEETFILHNIGSPIIYFHMMKSNFKEITNRMTLSGRYNIVVRFVLLEHEPHRMDVVAREAPVPGHIHIAHGKNVLTSQRNPRYRARDLSRNELKSSTR